MILKPKESVIAYRCPYCGTSILSMVGIFALSGDLIKLKCSCGDSALQIERISEEKVRITVPCIICPQPHVFTLGLNSFFSRPLITLACPFTGINVVFIGQEQKVRDALDETEKKLDELMKEAELDDFDQLRDANEKMQTDDAELHDAVRFVLAELREDGEITCDCRGDQCPEYDFSIDGREVAVFCRTCGAEYRTELNSTASVERFILTDHLTLEQPK